MSPAAGLKDGSHHPSSAPAGEDSAGIQPRPTDFMFPRQSEVSHCSTHVKTVRLAEAVYKTKRIQTEVSMATKLLGSDSKFENSLFELVVKSQRTSRFLWCLWWIGQVLGLLALGDVVPVYLVWSSLLMLPLPCCIFWLFSWDLVKEILGHFECYLVSALQLSVFVSSWRLLGDMRIVFWACYLPSMFVCALMDAYPSRYRADFSKHFFFGMGVALTAWALMLTFGWCSPLADQQWKMWRLEGRLASSTCTTIWTLLSYCCRFLFSAYFEPDTFVTIISSVRTVREELTAEVCEVDGTLKFTGKFLRRNKTNKLSMRQEDLEQCPSPLVSRKMNYITACKNLFHTGSGILRIGKTMTRLNRSRRTEANENETEGPQVWADFDNVEAASVPLATGVFDRAWPAVPSEQKMMSINAVPVTLGSSSQPELPLHDPLDTVASERQTVTASSTCSAASAAGDGLPSPEERQLPRPEERQLPRPEERQLPRPEERQLPIIEHSYPIACQELAAEDSGTERSYPSADLTRKIREGMDIDDCIT